MSAQEEKRDALVERLFMGAIGMGEILTVYLGDKLGLYRTLANSRLLTPPELASRSGIFERYAREWLEQQAAAGILEVDDPAATEDDRRYSLPEGHVDPLLDIESPFSMAPLAKSFVAVASAMPELLEAFRSGEGVSWDAYGRDMIEAQGDFNRPWLVGSLGTDYLPSIPDLHERLQADPPAKVADIASGVGWAGISLARAYPKITVDGFDLDELSIELANENAREAGVSDRVRFEARDAGDPSLEGRYDLAIVVESIHDMSDPVSVLAGTRRNLVPGGTLIVADERTEDAFTVPASETERLFYAYSVLCCLPSGMDADVSVGTGTVMRRSTFEGYAKEAGFDAVEVLALEHDFLRFYRLDRA
jgi:2-polyprenyl-3-methyl-5-hydroxy-6-metoxy-1,4-benzoquinol methylase